MAARGAAARAGAGASFAVGAAYAFLAAFFGFYYIRHRAAYYKRDSGYCDDVFHSHSLKIKRLFLLWKTCRAHILLYAVFLF